MESLPKNDLIILPPGTLEAVRKFGGLEKPGQMKEAVTALEEWARKQPHFLRTDFDIQFLENVIISSKGSIERAKVRLDKYCTIKTLMPKYYKKYDYNKSMRELKPLLHMPILPRLTSEYYRIICGKVNSVFEPQDYSNYYLHFIVGLEYMKKNDYFNGIILILDFRSTDLVAFFKNLNFLDLRDLLTIVIAGYAVRLKDIHLISSSKAIEVFVNFLKQVLKTSVGNRIKVHKNEESLYEYIDKDLLPEEYGGKEKSIEKLHEHMVQVLGSAEHMEYVDRMRKFSTDEALRPKDQYKESYIGMPGTFRMLSID